MASDNRQRATEVSVGRRRAKGKQVSLEAEVKWPTPRSCSAMAARITDEAIARAGDRFPNLDTVVAARMWPTPKAGRPDQATTFARGNPTLAQQVMWPTPTARDHKDGSATACANVPVNALLGRAVHTGTATPPTGSLNPAWVEWLMGWPVGWTALEPLATDRFRLWLQAHGGA